MLRNVRIACLMLLLPFALRPGMSSAADWPMWRFDARRSAATPVSLPAELELHWVRKHEPLVPVWEDPLNRDLMQFDRVYEPVVLDQVMVLGSNVRDCVIGVDTETGRELWRTYVSGPVRLPPAAGEGKVYCVSDDGRLYCLDLHSGEVLWSFSGGPGHRPILGNSRLISSWPARGGPVLHDGIVYFGAGLFSFMGTFVHALDAETGALVWTNDGVSSVYMLQPHNAPAYSGVAPQGALVVAGDRLLVPCGRSVPACFDRRTGEFLYYEHATYPKTGGAFVCAVGDWFINYYRDQVTTLYALADGRELLPRFARMPVAAQDRLYCLGDSITALNLETLRQIEYDQEVRDRNTGETRRERRTRWVIDRLWAHGLDATGDLIQAGTRLYAGGKGRIAALELSAGSGAPALGWQAAVDGRVGRLLAADNKLFAVTREGRIYAFGVPPGPAEAMVHRTKWTPCKPKRDAVTQASRILAAAGVDSGYALVHGVTDGELVAALAAQSDLHLIAVTPDAKRLDQLRSRFDAAGLYGHRVSVHEGKPATFSAPPYLAEITAFEDLQAAGFGSDTGFLAAVYASVRPYGGVACFPAAAAAEIRRQVQAATPGEPTSGPTALSQVNLQEQNGLFLMSREGPLPGSATWTHQYGDVANTVKSDDQRVRLPLGVLWFGGSSNMDVLPRHAHGPPEQVVGGRLFIEGIGKLSARDVYTGRVLWKRELPELGTYLVYYDSTYANTPLSTAYNQVHIPGANARGTNYVATAEALYVAQHDHALVLDPATGRTMKRIRLPADPDTGKTPSWGYIGVYQDLLIAGAGAVTFADYLDLTPAQRQRAAYDLSTVASKGIVVFDRHTGAPLWHYTSRYGLRNNTIVAGDGKLFCIDMPSPLALATLRRRGRTLAAEPALLGLDIRTGETIWRRTEGVFGTWLGYSEEHGVLLQAGRKTRDTVADEPDSGMVAYRGADGTQLWRNNATYGGPCILHGAQIITDRHAYSLLTGEQRMRRNPVTDAEEPWTVTRRYGCNYNIGSEYLLTFRSGTAGYYDLEGDSGTGNLGSFRSGCTSNLVAADGVLNAPDYTRTCSCAYPLQTSVALIHDPQAAVWVTYPTPAGDAAVRSLGLNLGAPGNRRAPDGRFWLAHPLLPHVADPAGESGLSAAVTVDAPEGSVYTHHASYILEASEEAGAAWPWVAASGYVGIRSLEVDLQTPDPGRYAVRVHFAEPESLNAGARVFSVSAEGRTRLSALDVVAAAGGPRRPVVRDLGEVKVTDGKLSLELVPADSSIRPPLLCGVEIQRVD